MYPICTYSGSLTIPDVIPCVDTTGTGAFVIGGSSSTVMIDPISEEMVQELAVGEVTLMLSFTIIFVIFFFIKKYV